MRIRFKRTLCLLISLSLLFSLSAFFTVSGAATATKSPMVSIGNGFMIAQTDSGNLWAWGSSEHGIVSSTTSTPVAVSLPTGVKSVKISAGFSHALVLGSDGNVYAWGSNSYGQLGIEGDSSNVSAPTLVEGLRDKNVIDVKAGREFSVVLTESGSVYTFGANAKLQLGYNSTSDTNATPLPVDIADNVFVTAISVGQSSVSAIDADGKLYMWGDDSEYQLGADKQPTLPREFTTTKTQASFVASAFGAKYSAHLLSDGTIGFLGLNKNGEYGNGTTTDDGSKVLKVTAAPAGATIVAVAAADQQTVVLTREGKVYTAGLVIGSDDSGEKQTMLTPFFSDRTSAPFAASIAAAYSNGAFVAQDGSVWIWGDNTYGQLGNGTTTNSASPVRVCGADDTDFVLGGTPYVKNLFLSFATSVPAPTFTVTIPGTIDVGELKQVGETANDRYKISSFDISVSNVAYFFGENKIVVTVANEDENGDFYLQDASGTILPYKLLPSPDATEALESGAVLGEFLQDGTITTWIEIDQSKIFKSGIYNGKLIFNYSVVSTKTEEGK